MPNFYSKFPKIDYKFPDGTTHQLTDINIKYTLSNLVKTRLDSFYPFAYRDQDRPDILADKYYDSDNYYWLVLMSNDIFDINHDFAIPSNIFNEYLYKKYEDSAIATGLTGNFDNVIGYCFDTIHHYEDKDGYHIDFDTFHSIGNTTSVSIYEYEFKLNEEKRAIRFLDASKKSSIQNELDDKLRKLKADLGQ